MTLSNWIYLGIGLGLGLAGNWLFKSRQLDVSPTPVPSQDIAVSSMNQEDNQDVVRELKTAQAAYQLAREMSQFKGGFLARTSHELRSPLNSLIGLLQLILSDLCDDPAEEREFVAQAHESALKLVKLIDEILNVARTEHGTNNLEIQPLQLSTVFQEVYDLTHLLAANRNFPFQVSLPDREIYVLADPRWLRQVLVSLVQSSISQMESQMEEGSIGISAQPAPIESVNIWVDIQLPASSWCDEVDLLQSVSPDKAITAKVAPSPGMTLLLNQTVLELMRGNLQVVPPPVAERSQFTRLQIQIPLVIPETEFLEQAAK